MESGDLISTYFKDDGGIAKVYRISEKEHSYYSIAYFNSRNVMICEEEFKDNSLSYVEDAAENWTLGIKKLP